MRLAQESGLLSLGVGCVAGPSARLDIHALVAPSVDSTYSWEGGGPRKSMHAAARKGWVHALASVCNLTVENFGEET